MRSWRKLGRGDVPSMTYGRFSKMMVGFIVFFGAPAPARNELVFLAYNIRYHSNTVFISSLYCILLTLVPPITSDDSIYWKNKNSR